MGPILKTPIAFLTLVERKILVFIKEPVKPSTSSPTLFLITPTLALTLAHLF
uniref:NADH dehydrogenase subunit 1 n=1 Tax=Erpetoichthys calabaricus TaxID=27687 RepID=A0A8C4SG07_ERPCA